MLECRHECKKEKGNKAKNQEEAAQNFKIEQEKESKRAREQERKRERACNV